MNSETVKLENYLGKTTDVLANNNIIEILEKEITNSEEKISIREYRFTSNYFGIQPIHIHFSFDKDNLVKAISINFAGIMSELFYNEFIKIYDAPSRIFKMDKLKYESKTSLNHQNLTKREFSTKSVTFNQHPDFIIWKKEFYDIKIRFDYKIGVSNIMFM